MSEWDFLFGLEGQELLDAMSSGATEAEWVEIERALRKTEWIELKKLRDNKEITKEEFKMRKQHLFQK